MKRYEWKAGDDVPTEWPDWMKAARIERCTIEVNDDGWVVWLDGVWLDGEWRDGVWRGGEWLDGVWLDGVWLDGVWRGGEWRGGVWRGGEWRDGVWRGGVWRGGEWRDGVWRGGVWLDGVSKPRCKWSIYGHGDVVHIGCKQQTIAEWDAFFAGTEVYETARDTEAFRLIRAAYLAQRAWQLALAEPTTQPVAE